MGAPEASLIPPEENAKSVLPERKDVKGRL